MSEATHSSLIPVSSSALCRRLGLAGALLDLGLAVAGQVTQGADRLGRDEARPQKPRLGELADPGSVGDIRLAAGDRLDVAGVDEHALELLLEHRPDGFQ